jgi:arylsulfatase A-like enzyme
MKYISIYSCSTLCIVTTAAYPNNEPLSKKPNIIIIYADDLGYGDLSTYGGTIQSPNIQRIADTGIKFTNFYVSAPVSTPSRYSLLTGCYPQRSVHGLVKAGMPGEPECIDKNETLLPGYLKEAGYRTALFGKWHLGAANAENYPVHHGFDVFTGFPDGCIDYFRHTYGTYGKSWYKNDVPFEEEGYSTDLITNHALNFIREQKLKENPYFILLAYNAPHFGKSDPEDLPDSTLILNKDKYAGFEIANTLQVPSEYLKRYSEIKDPYRQMYSAMVASLDDNIGRILDELEKTGTLENTMIWFISDNGGYSISYFGHASNGSLRGEKQQLYEGGIRVPAIVCWKSRIKANMTNSQVLCNIDIVPTLAKITGFDILPDKKNIDGIDISDVLFSQKAISRDLFWKFSVNNQRAFRRGDWKIFNNELYNLRDDPGEKNNVAGENPLIYSELDAGWMKIDEAAKPFKK